MANIYVRIIDNMDTCAAADLTGIETNLIYQEGLIKKDEGGDFAVSQSDTPALSVDVAAGLAYILRDAYVEDDNTQKFWAVEMDAEQANVSIDANSSGSTRIDLVCIKIDTTASPDANASNVASIVIVKGTPGAGAPAVPSNHLKLAEVSVADGATTITNANITDYRRYAGMKVPGFLRFYELGSTPATPDANTVQLYAKDDAGVTKLYTLDANDTETEVGSGGSNLSLTAAPTSDHEANGIKITLTAAANLAFGDVCYIASTGKATLVDADAIANASGLVMCVDASISADASGTFLMIGIARDDTWAWTVGGLIYITVTGTTGNTLSQTQPSGTDDVIQIVGVATHADRMFFNPNLMQIEHV